MLRVAGLASHHTAYSASIPFFFSFSQLSGRGVRAAACEQHDSLPPYTSTPSLSATICPTIASHHSSPPSKPINTPLSLSAATLAHKPATAAISHSELHIGPTRPCFVLCNPSVSRLSYMNKSCVSRSTTSSGESPSGHVGASERCMFHYKWSDEMTT